MALDYLQWLSDVKGAKPSTLTAVRSDLAEPGVAYRRGTGVRHGRIMKALGDRPAREITTREINALLRTISAAGVAPRTVNEARALICAIFNYGLRPGHVGPVRKPGDLGRSATGAGSSPSPLLQRRADRGARAGDGERWPSGPDRAGRRGERAGDPHGRGRPGRRTGPRGCLLRSSPRRADDAPLERRPLPRSQADRSRTLSADVEADSPKGGRFREVPLPDQAAAALDRLSRRPDYTGPDEYVFCNRFGRRLDPFALRRRYERARDAAELPPLRFHDLRHTYGSLLVASGIDLVSVKSAMGHANMSTTERYLHARPATELAERFTLALRGTNAPRAEAADRAGS